MVRQSRTAASAISSLRGRSLLLPVGVIAAVLLVLFLGIRAIQGQQQHQVNQRFDSLIASAQQLEKQARASTDHTQAQNLIHQAQGLLDQAATIKHDQVPVATVRKALLDDLDKLSNTFELPDPSVLATFDGSSKDAGAVQLVGDSSALYVLDTGQQKVFQVMRVQKSKSAVVSKGDQAGPNQMGVPQFVAAAEGGSLLVLDADHKLWSYTPSKNALTLVGLKGTDAWKGIQDVATYGGNVYVLDATAGNIFRYVPKEGQYPDAPTRFFETDNKVPLSQAIRMAIDGSIWVLKSDGSLLKLANGEGQAVPTTGLPQPIGKAADIYTSVDTHSLYILDASSNRVVQLGKDGSYQRQLNLGLPQPAKAIWVDEANRSLYALANNTLYSYQLPQ